MTKTKPTATKIAQMMAVINDQAAMIVLLEGRIVALEAAIISKSRDRTW